jgi:enolase
VLDSICLASDGYKVKVGLDCAGSHLIKNKYNTEFYKKLINNYPIIFLEDPFGENDWNSWRNLKKSIKNKYKVLLVGDDLTVTNPTRIKLAQTKKVCDAVIIKPNQVGSVSEAMESVALAKSYNWKTIVSHRSGETMDDFISDFAVGVQSDYIKIGAPFAKERFVKYKRLIKIEESLN